MGGVAEPGEEVGGHLAGLELHRLAVERAPHPAGVVARGDGDVGVAVQSCTAAECDNY